MQHAIAAVALALLTTVAHAQGYTFEVVARTGQTLEPGGVR